MRKTFLAAVSAAALAGGAFAALPASASPIANTLAGVTTGIAADNVAYFFRGRDYCFYPDGWHGPGWYWCGYRWHRGLGWGGVVGWNSWDVGPRWRHRFGGDFDHRRDFGRRDFDRDRGERMGRDFDRDRGGRDFDRGGRHGPGGFSEDRSSGRQPGMNMNEGRSSSMGGGRGPGGPGGPGGGGMGPGGPGGGASSHGAGGGGGAMGGGHGGGGGGGAGAMGGGGGGGGGGDRH